MSLKRRKNSVFIFKTAQYSQNRTENFHQHSEITVGAPFKVYDFNTKLYSKLHHEDFIPDLVFRVRLQKNHNPTELQLLFRQEHSPQHTARSPQPTVCQSEPRASQARLGLSFALCTWAASSHCFPDSCNRPTSIRYLWRTPPALPLQCHQADIWSFSSSSIYLSLTSCLIISLQTGAHLHSLSNQC